MSGVNLYHSPDSELPQSMAITVASVNNNGLHIGVPFVTTGPSCQVPPKAGEAFFLEGRAELADRCFHCARNWLRAAGLFLKYWAVGTDIRGGGTLGACWAEGVGNAACASVWAWLVAEAPSSSESANAPAAMERQSRCDVLEAAVEVEDSKEGIDELTNDTKVSKRADGVAMSEISLNVFLDGTL